MNVKIIRPMCIFAVSAALCVQSPAVLAEIIPTDQAVKQSQTTQEKEKVQQFMERTDVKNRLQVLGVDETKAADRVASLNDEEVHALAQKIDSMPAGGNLGESDLIIILLVAILVAIAI